MSPQRVVIIHGYNANPASHWFAAVADALAVDGIVVDVTELPDPTSPSLDRWVAAAREAIGEIDEHTVIVAHSLGSITTLRVLADRFRTAESGGRILGALISVAGFDQPLPTLPKLDAFTVDPPALAPIAARIRRRIVIVSDHDDVVAPDLTKDFAHRFDAELVEIDGGGHFRARDGFDDFPALTALIREAI